MVLEDRSEDETLEEESLNARSGLTAWNGFK
jgi:hypothetical protein